MCAICSFVRLFVCFSLIPNPRGERRLKTCKDCLRSCRAVSPLYWTTTRLRRTDRRQVIRREVRGQGGQVKKEVGKVDRRRQVPTKTRSYAIKQPCWNIERGPTLRGVDQVVIWKITIQSLHQNRFLQQVNSNETKQLTHFEGSEEYNVSQRQNTKNIFLLCVFFSTWSKLHNI